MKSLFDSILEEVNNSSCRSDSLESTPVDTLGEDNMYGPFELNQDEINKQVKLSGTPGNYLYGTYDNNVFTVYYVGRSDTDLKSRVAHGIRDREENPSLRKLYTHFKFSYAWSPEEAYRIECKQYHVASENSPDLQNKEHPDAPDGADLFCLICGK